MSELVCIVCPNGCVLNVEKTAEGIKIEGAKCKRGVKFAEEEMTCPKRTVCTTMKTVFKEIPVIPVRTSVEIPKDLIFELMKIVAGITLDKKFKRGEAVIKNVLNTDADIITTSDMTRY